MIISTSSQPCPSHALPSASDHSAMGKPEKLVEACFRTHSVLDMQPYLTLPGPCSWYLAFLPRGPVVVVVAVFVVVRGQGRALQSLFPAPACVYRTHTVRALAICAPLYVQCTMHLCFCTRTPVCHTHGLFRTVCPVFGGRAGSPPTHTRTLRRPEQVENKYKHKEPPYAPPAGPAGLSHRIRQK